jgi:hypothetical protein
VQSIAEILGGAGVNYTVIIDLEQVPSALRWGMTAFVDIEGSALMSQNETILSIAAERDMCWHPVCSWC